MSEPDVSRPFIEAASPTHPSLLDPTHQMDALFGVVNIPNVVWIDEDGMIVRPAEPGWASGDNYPDWLQGYLDDRDAKVEAKAAAIEDSDPDLAARLRGGQVRATYADAIRDWVANGSNSEYAMTPEQVLAASQPRSAETSAAAAHFELANHLWRSGEAEASYGHFREAHRLQPDNWTYKRQAWSVVGNEQAGGGELGRFNQGPMPDREDEWPFEGDFPTEAGATPAADYYPQTLHEGV